MRTLWILAALALGCSKDDSGATGEELEPATWEEVRDDVLVPSCGFGTCHAPPGAAGFEVDNTTEASQFIGVPANGQSAAVLVAAGNPDGSYLLMKLEGSDNIAGEPMPPPQGGLPADKIERVRSWIASLE